MGQLSKSVNQSIRNLFGLHGLSMAERHSIYKQLEEYTFYRLLLDSKLEESDISNYIDQSEIEGKIGKVDIPSTPHGEYVCKNCGVRGVYQFQIHLVLNPFELVYEKCEFCNDEHLYDMIERS